MGIRNVPTDEAASLASLVNAREGTVSSRSLTRGEGFGMFLFAFAAGESVSEETYLEDAMYYQVEGCSMVRFDDRVARLAPGDVLAVPAGISHAIEPADAYGFKILQVFVPAE